MNDGYELHRLNNSGVFVQPIKCFKFLPSDLISVIPLNNQDLRKKKLKRILKKRFLWF